MAVELDLLDSELEELGHETRSDGISGLIGTRLIRFLGDYVEAHNLGWVFNAETDFKLAGIDNRRPDVAFCSFKSLPEVLQAVIAVPPDLAVEITSSRDEIDPTDKKVKEYRSIPVKLVWVIKPEGEVVEVYRDGKVAELLDVEGELDGDPVIPGFKLSVCKLFELPKPPR